MEESGEQSSSVHIGGLPAAMARLRPVFEQALREMFLRHGVSRYALSVTFVGDGEIARLNRESLGREGPTDVIAFDLSEEGLPLERVGDVYISLDTARANSRRFHVSAGEELLRLVVHGALHVLGHTDRSPGGRRKMESLQEELVLAFSDRLRGQRSGKEDD